MRHDYFTPTLEASYKVAILVSDIRMDEIKRIYVDPSGLPESDFLILSIHTRPGKKKKTPTAEIKEYFTTELIPVLEQYQIENLLVSDADYFKTLAKQTTAEPHLGYALPCAFGPWSVIYTPAYRTLFYDPPKIGAKIQLALNAVAGKVNGTYVDPGTDVVKFAAYPRGEDEIAAWLQKLLDMKCDLASDIEAFSLKHYDAGIGSISFAWNSGEGVAFLVDMTEDQTREFNAPVRAMLRDFFYALKAQGNHVKWHNIAYDVTVLIQQLYMSDILDTEGLYEGLYYLASDWDCTKLITYLATNSCSGNELGLKAQTREFSGNYALEEIRDILQIPYQSLLLYNLIDSIGTWHTYDKRWPEVLADQQEEIYRTIFKPAMRDIIHMQLVGMPINMARTLEVKGILEKIQDDAVDRIQKSILVQEFVYNAQHAWVKKRNLELKKKRVTIADVGDNADFNPNSPDQLQRLLFEQIGLPILGVTEAGAPETGGDTLKSLLNHTKDQRVIDLLSALVDFKAVNKIVTSFIPAMLNAQLGKDGWHYLFGNLNLGGTVSGRLSSSDPNMQNLPANSIYAKLIKSCFQAPPGWLYCGLDYDSLEDRISALTTKDPNKLKVYTDGYDGHCLRAFYYFPERLPGIVDTKDSINSIKKLFPDVRQDSKAPTFALTYQGTWSTLVRNCGFSEATARAIESRYHDLYQVSDQWVANQLNQATKDGYITGAFGLRIRTPKLHQVFLNTRRTPTSAAAEGRTAGNALGQSWCLLNNRAGSEFMAKVRASEFWADIRPCVHIHDAQYYLIREDLEALAFANEHLVTAVRWQDHPLIAHPEVKLGGELSIFHPTWVEEITLPNAAITSDSIQDAVDQAMAERQKKAAEKAAKLKETP